MEQKPSHLEKLWETAQWPLYFILFLWLILLADLITGRSLSAFGILPRHLSGLKGIFFAPLIHGSPGHLFNNSIPLLISSAVIIHFYKRIAVVVIAMIWLLTGLLVWIFAKPAFHIGASGLVYGMVSFIFWTGLFNQDRKSIVLALIMLFLYGGMFIGILPDKPGVSWESHLIGGLVGILIAYVFRIPKEEDPWEEDGPHTHQSYFSPDTFTGTNPQNKNASSGNDDYWTSHRS